MQKEYYQVRDFETGELLCYTRDLEKLKPNKAPNKAFRVFKETLTDGDFDFLCWLETALAQNRPFSECYNPDTKKFSYGTGVTKHSQQTWTIWNPYSSIFYDNILQSKSCEVKGLAEDLLNDYRLRYDCAPANKLSCSI